MNVFHLLSTRRAKEAASHEIDPEDVFLDSQNLSSLNINQLEGQLSRPLGVRVYYLFTIFIVVLFGATVFRLFGMQITDFAVYQEKADRNHLRTTPIFAHRGTISDVNGDLIAWNSSKGEFYEIPDRIYTSTPGFSHLLGYVSYPKKDQSGVFWQDEYIGRDGIEKQYQDRLAGQRGEKVVAVNALHKIEAENVTIDPTNGENLKLTIDKGVQAKLYESMEALAHKAYFTSGAGVIMDVNTGAVLAIASYPEYNNNLMTNATSTEDKKIISKDLLDKNKKFLNRAVAGAFTPGSTVKPFIAMAALMEGVISPLQNIYSSGQLVIKNKYGGPDSVFKDWKAHGYTDMRKALAESSDEYFYQVGGGFENQKGLGIARINKYAKLFGFGTTTGIDLPGEVHGNVPSPEWKKKVFNEDWLLGNTYHTAIGQYGFQLTTLELVRGIAVIANGGTLVTPHMIDGVVTASSKITLPEKDLKVVREGMHMVVHEDNGTGTALNIPGIDVAAKTGSAELGVSKQLVNSLITGYFPYENPKYAFVVVMEKGDRHNTYGSVLVMQEVLLWMRDNTTYTK
ncbi:MAG: penicillin-binding transpeptidase domain-containing protein [Candidatus Nomurabacteria bacterium]|nr:penicillin-binding transpeptidase domain-containing protein [Candidatus Nomurabacteria bacterium]